MGIIHEREEVRNGIEEWAEPISIEVRRIMDQFTAYNEMSLEALQERGERESGLRRNQFKLRDNTGKEIKIDAGGLRRGSDSSSRMTDWVEE
jgi:hypothetical protein